MTREQFIFHVEGTQRAFRRFLVALCCGDAALADDVAQESYLKAYLSCDDFHDTEKFKAWLFRIGYNTYIDHKRMSRPSTDYAQATAAVASETSDSAFRYEALYSALDSLPDKERISVLLYYMEGYSIKEVSEIEQISQDAVKQHLSRGRKHLRGILSNQ